MIYAVEFQTLSVSLGWNNNALYDLFFKYLKFMVKDSIVQQDHAIIFETLRDQAIHFDQFQHHQQFNEAKKDKIANPYFFSSERKRSIVSISRQSMNNQKYDKRKSCFKIPWKEYERRKALDLYYEYERRSFSK